MEKLFLMGGLPRSGSTLLGALLNQHPDVYCTASSPAISLYSGLNNTFDNPRFMEGQMDYIQAIKDQFIAETVSNFYAKLTDKKYIIDKSRAWNVQENIDGLSQTVLNGEYPKVILPVRSAQDILASWENFMTKQDPDWDILKLHNVNFIGPINDLNSLLEGGQLDDYIIIVEYEDLVEDPQGTIDRICEFLEIDTVELDLTNIKPSVPEDDYDAMMQLPGLHDVKSTIVESTSNEGARERLGKVYETLEHINTWRMMPRFHKDYEPITDEDHSSENDD